MNSSGQLVEETVIGGVCPECGFADDVDAIFDPEISAGDLFWMCPSCGGEHRTNLEDD